MKNQMYNKYIFIYHTFNVYHIQMQFKLWINKKNQDLNLFFILLFIDIFINISKKSKM